MRKYGEVAVRAAEMTRSRGTPATEAWDRTAQAVFPHSPSLQEKACPRVAYLGLCEDKLVVGVPAGTYTRSGDNKKYAIRAVELLATQRGLADAGPKALWELVLRGRAKAHNSQMDVVLALWQHGLISFGGGGGD
jgi:hypothetical protein